MNQHRGREETSQKGFVRWRPLKQRLKMHDTLVWSLRMCRPFNVLSLSTFSVAYGQMCSQWQITTLIIEKKGACLPTPAAVTPQNCG